MEIPSTSSNQLRNQFMTLLLAQLRNQDPLSPVQQHEFITQLSQFSSLEGIEQLNEGVGRLAALQDSALRQQELLQARQWIGAHLQYYRHPDDAATQSGVVEGVVVDAEGIRLVVGQDQVPLGQVAAIVAPPSTQAAAAPPPSAAGMQPAAAPPPETPRDSAVAELLAQLKDLI